ncbi:MAG: hypothetical protein U5K43_05030 [Halofilum sp. (in: g-proteobacteria)]|nr:hypothetical protein [Halofilum sp. (in: g-proteobacteria)]
MRTALALEFAQLAARGETDAAGRLVGANALELLEPPPSGYAPGAGHDDWGEAPPGTWFFDPGRDAVVYRATRPGVLPGDALVAAWRAVAQGRDADGDGRVEPGAEPVSGVDLERLRPPARQGNGSRE